MKKVLLIALGAIALVGCSPTYNAAYANRKQLLDSQFDSISSVQYQMQELYNRNGSTMENWPIHTKMLYQNLQLELSHLYNQRQQLINQLGGTQVDTGAGDLNTSPVSNPDPSASPDPTPSPT